MADPRLIASQTTTAMQKLGPFVPAILFVLSDNPQVPMDEVLDWERRLLGATGDFSLRLVYADWLHERGCLMREVQIRSEAESLRLTAGNCVGWNVTAQRVHQEEHQPPPRLGVRWDLQWSYACPRPPASAAPEASG